MPDPILGSDIPLGVPSDGDTVFSIDGGQTRRFLLEDIGDYIVGDVSDTVVQEMVQAGFITEVASYIVDRYSTLLGEAQYVTAGSVIVETASTSLVAVDATNLAVTFTATTPQVEVEFTSYGRNDNSSGTLIWGLLDQDDVAVPDSSATVVSGNTLARRYHTCIVSGLIPGEEYTFKWAHATNGTGNAQTRHSPSWGPAVMKVRSVPNQAAGGTVTAPAMLNVKAFGAVGDGDADDTVPFQNAADAANAAGGAAIFVPAGDYNVDTIIFDKRVKLVGEGRSTSRLYAIPGSTAPGLLQIVEGDVTYIEIDGIGLSGNADNADQWGIYFYARGDGASPNDGGLWFSSFKSMNIMQFERGSVWLRGGGEDNLCPHQFITFEDCRMSYDTTTPPEDWVGFRATGQVGQVNLRMVQISGKNGAGTGVEVLRETDENGDNISDRRGYNVLFTACTIERVATGALVQRAFSVKFDNCYFEDVDYCVNVTTSAGMIVVRDSSFSSCGADGSGGGYLMRVHGANSVGKFDGNYSWGGTEDAVTLTASGGTCYVGDNNIT